MVVSVGVDVAEERKGLDLVALDSDQRVVAQVAHADIGEVSAAAAKLRPDVVAIDSPPAWAVSGRSRAAERALAKLGITAFRTPTDPGTHPFYRWMRVGFSVFAAIADTYPRYRRGPVRATAIEVFPEASAVLLAGQLRSKDEPKTRFRRRILADQGIDTAELSTLDAIDAALAALTGLLALSGQFQAVGAPDEGVIVVPVRALPPAPLVRPLVVRRRNNRAVSPASDAAGCVLVVAAPQGVRLPPASLPATPLTRRYRAAISATHH